MFSFLRPSIKQSTKTLGESIFDEIIYNLKEKYQKRIDSKLAGRFPVNLRITASIKGTSKETAQNFITLQDEEVGSEIGQIFDRAHGRLLVVGLPGAGKTTLLLQLAVELLKRAETVPATLVAGTPAAKAAGTVTRPIPVLLNLATWRSEFATFDEWLKRILPNELGASKALAEKIRANIPLIFLLDGLDEVPEGDRNSCLEALGQYGIRPDHQFVISSRINEYTITRDAPVYSQVEVAPLTAEQIEINLIAYAGHTPEAKPLLNAIQKDPLLKEAIENPFYLNTAQLLFASGKNWAEFGFIATDLNGRQKELVQWFVENALRQKVRRDYPKEKSKKWLGFLAEKMEEGKLRVFELTDLQPWWGKRKLPQILIFLILGGPILFLIGGIVFNLLKPTFNLIDANWQLNLMHIGGIYGIVFNLSSLMVSIGGKIRDRLFWSWATFYENWWSVFWRSNVFYFWRATLVFAIISLFFITGAFNGSFVLMPYYAFVIGVNFGFGFGIISGIFSSIKSGFFVDSILKNKSPYQKFINSMRNFDFSIIVHFSIRSSVYLENLLPLRLVFFLNEMSRRYLLEFDGNLETETGGGTWRWRHRIIQEYFLPTKTTTAKSDNQEENTQP